MDGSSGDAAGDVTLRTYEASTSRYIEQSTPYSEARCTFLDEFARLAQHGLVLEVGSGPGTDADYLERLGLQVRRTDGAAAFVELMRRAGHDAEIIDIRTGELGGPYRAVLAQAVLLHLDRHEFLDVLARFHGAVGRSGILGFTVKEGDGAGWSNAKLDLPRHFTYWREPGLQSALANTGWEIISLVHVQGRSQPWIHVVARAR